MVLDSTMQRELVETEEATARSAEASAGKVTGKTEALTRKIPSSGMRAAMMQGHSVVRRSNYDTPTRLVLAKACFY